MSGFHGAVATGVACQQGTLTLPDTWFRPPFWDLLMLQLLRPNSSNLPCLYSTFHLEYPLVLSRFCFTKCRSIVEEALQSYCKRWCKKENVGVHALNDWKNEFLRIIDIRIENFTKHPHLYKQSTSRSVKSLKRQMEKLHSKCVFAPADKAANNVIII